MCHVGVVSVLTPEKRCSAWAALGNRNEMIFQKDALINDELVDSRLSLERPQSIVLIVRHDDHNVRRR